MIKRHPGTPLSVAELEQRRDAAHHRHKAETAPSVRQGSSGAPSPAAAGLFRQGQQRPDSRGGRGVWDTRTEEEPVGSVNARFRLHLPKAYRSTLPNELLPTPKHGTLLAEALAEHGVRSRGGKPISGSRNRIKPHRDLMIENPGTFVEAMRHPRMREVLQQAIGIVRAHQKGAIEEGHKRKLIPVGTKPGTVARAYKHAALLALHKAGVGDYDFRMDQAAKREFRPLTKFMRYAYRRVFDRLHSEAPAESYEPFKQEFGTKWHRQGARLGGRLAHVERYRMRPNERFVKQEPYRTKAVEKMKKSRPFAGIDAAYARLAQRKVAEAAAKRPAALREAQILDAATRPRPSAIHPPPTKEYREPKVWPPPKRLRKDWAGLRPHPIVAGVGVPVQHISNSRLRRAMKHGHSVRLSLASAVPLPPGGLPPPAHPAQHVKDAARHVEHHFGAHQLNKISGAACPDPELIKLDASFMLGNPDPQPNFGYYSSDPARLLRRAMRPRMHRVRKLRLKNRSLNRQLRGGATYQERWMFGPRSNKAEADGDLHKGPVAKLRALGSRIAAHPQVARALHEAAEQGLPKTPLYRIGRISGAYLGGERSAKIGGNIGRTIEAVPLVLGGVHLLSSKRRREFKDEQLDRLRQIKALPTEVHRDLLGKGILGAVAQSAGTAIGRTVGGAASLAGRAAFAPVKLGGKLAWGATKLGAKGALGTAKIAGKVAAPVARVAGKAALGTAKIGGRAAFGAARGYGRAFARAGTGGRIGLVAGLGAGALTARSLADPYVHGVLGNHISQAIAPFRNQDPAEKMAKGITGKALGAVGRSIRKHPVAAGVAGLGLGLYGPKAVDKVKEFEATPRGRKITGAVAGGAVAAGLSRTVARRGVIGASRALYASELKDATRAHVRALTSGRHSPHQLAQARQVKEASQRLALHHAKAVRAAGLAGRRASGVHIAAGAALGGALGAAVPGGPGWSDVPQPYNP